MYRTALRLNHRKISDLTALVCVLGFAAWFSSGAPILRHDWPSPHPAVGTMVAALSGWDPVGMGAPVGYPSSFIAAAVQYGVLNAFGPYAGTLVWQIFIASVCAFGAQSCARVFSTSWSAQAAAAIFALFNPWVYNQVVAGHAFMLLSYGGTFWLAREALSPTSELRLIVSGLLIAPQIQFFAIEWPLLLFVAVRDRRLRALTAWVLLSLPIVVGMFATRTILAGTPLTIAWERLQSIDPVKALLLLGYFPHYALFDGVARAADWAVFGCAALGAVLVFAKARRFWPLPALTALAIAIAVGFNAPWHAAVRWAFASVPETGLLRELYGVLGLAAVGYVLLCAFLAGRARYAGVAWAAASLCLLAGWIARPPATYWVAAGNVPSVAVDQEPNSRFALLPAFQPMQYRGRGSGIDPDSYSRAANITPLNEFLASYPVAAAFGRYLRDRDARYLAALSVARVYGRPYLQSNLSDLRYQWSFQDARTIARLRATGLPALSVLRYLPELTVSAMPAVGALDTNIGAGNVLFSDARSVRGPYVPQKWKTFGAIFATKAPNVYVKAKDGWVDARLAFAERPELAQTFGGALTTNPRALLRIVPRHEALVWIDGALLAGNGRRLSGGTSGYAWIEIPVGVSAVRCIGTCVVAAQGDPPHVPANPPPHATRETPFVAWTPWLTVATLPPSPVRLLRYNVAYDSHWMALLAGTALPHVRVDGIVNGWIAPPHARPLRVLIVESGAAATSAAEALCVIGLLALIFVELRVWIRASGLYRNAARVIDPVQ